MRPRYFRQRQQNAQLLSRTRMFHSLILVPNLQLHQRRYIRDLGHESITVRQRSRKVIRVGITSSFLKLLSSDENIAKTMQTIKNSEEKE